MRNSMNADDVEVRKPQNNSQKDNRKQNESSETLSVYAFLVLALVQYSLRFTKYEECSQMYKCKVITFSRA
ncbi:uncharacterized protein PRCAT00006227001 [Priceomyces carsonii]|uniref:uncharacterized protein n=1 Tax=Priceomyces carsonii TaxID=28549 RepID=UPI002ED84049|nr:unnamed protein product [Priceomyces carsonii]